MVLNVLPPLEIGFNHDDPQRDRIRWSTPEAHRRPLCLLAWHRPLEGGIQREQKSLGAVELKDFNALRTNSSTKRIPENQVASFPEATRTCHEKTRCYFEGTLWIGDLLCCDGLQVLWKLKRDLVEPCLRKCIHVAYLPHMVRNLRSHLAQAIHARYRLGRLGNSSMSQSSLSHISAFSSH